MKKTIFQIGFIYILQPIDKMNKMIKIYSTRFIVKTNHVCMRAYIHSWHLYTHLWMLNEKKIDKMKIESSIIQTQIKKN
jgi:hypothetical protein